MVEFFSNENFIFMLRNVHKRISLKKFENSNSSDILCFLDLTNTEVQSRVTVLLCDERSALLLDNYRLVDKYLLSFA